MNAPQPRPLEPGFETEYATRLIGADTLLGGDVKPPEGAAHFIADTYPADEVKLPQIYDDESATAIRTDGGADPKNVEAVRKLIDTYGLLERGRLVATLGEDELSLRRRFVENMETGLDVMTRTALAIAEGQPLPPYEERFRAAAKREPELVETQELRERLQTALAARGFAVTTSRNLRETVKAWEQGVGYVPAERFAERVNAVRAQLMLNTRVRVLRAACPHLADAPFDGLIFRTVSNVHYTGSSAFRGGTKEDGSPASAGLLEYNTDHPVTEPGLWHLFAHEVAPGHYVDSVASDLEWRAGKLGLEGVAHTMCTAETAAREGVAQNALALAFGGKEQDVLDTLGSDHTVEHLLQRMQDAGKQNASIWHQLRGLPIEEVQKLLAVECALSDPIVKKLSGGWAKHPILGPMYGPAYATGYRAVRDAIDKHGAQKVANVAMHQRGFTDIETFVMALDNPEIA